MGEINYTKMDAVKSLEVLKGFIPTNELSVIGDSCRTEEKQFFFNKIVEIANIIKTMPKTYEQDGLGMDSIAYLHYFKNSMDWYITEKDMENEQCQAFGYADLGFGGGDLGYISIVELLENQIELDLHFTPKTLKELIK